MCVEGQLRSSTVERKGCNGLDMWRGGRVKKDMQRAGVAKDDTGDRVIWRQMICRGDP